MRLEFFCAWNSVVKGNGECEKHCHMLQKFDKTNTYMLS